MNWYEGASKIRVWKHHIAKDYEINGVPTIGNGVGKGGTVFTDFDKMKDWLAHNDTRKFYFAPITMCKDELDFEFDVPFMATSLVQRTSDGPFAPVSYWEKR